jgi:multiple sugar transport system ATP-binding protein
VIAVANLKLVDLNKYYPNGVHAVKDLNVEIEDKEFIVLVGPSGCGKSTVLRMIAGLEEISSGELYIDGELVNNVPPKDRDIAMVFQNYALYPHMSIYDNMGFGLKLRKMPKEKIRENVENAAKILGLEDLLDRKPKELSGGQRQRVALGRAIVRDPNVFLMDEPLSNLDAKLRVQTRAELSKLHTRLETTFIYVTHDQIEAMTMGTRIVVLQDGVAHQIADPDTLYRNPIDKFVAGFIGSPQMNFIEAELNESNGKVSVEFKGGLIELNAERSEQLKKNDKVQKEVVLGIRPEHINVSDIGDAKKNIATVEVTELLGSDTYLFLELEGNTIIARVDPTLKIKVHDKLKVEFEVENLHLFDKKTEDALFYEEK